MKINKVVIETDCLEEMYAFYVDKLGCKEMDKQEGSFQIAIGTSVLECKKSKNERKRLYHFACNIPSNQLQEAKTWITQKGITLNTEQGIDEMDFGEAGASACYFYDPAGNVVECIARKEIERSTEPFSVTSLREISEINLTTNNVVHVANRLAAYGLPLRDGEQPKEDGFHFVGEKEEGNFLLLGPVNRRWIFSNIHAEIHPLTIIVNNTVQITVNDKEKMSIEQLEKL